MSAKPTYEELVARMADLEARHQEQLRQVGRQAAHEAHRRGTELEALLDAVPALVFVTRDPQCRYIVGNRLTREILGLPPDANLSKSAPPQEQPTVIFMKDGKEIPPDDLPVQQASRGRKVLDYELDMVLEDGSVRTLLGNAWPLVDESGKPAGAVGAFMDITIRTQAQNALRKSEQWLMRTQEIAHLGSWELDLLKDELTWSDETYRIFGLRPQEFGATYEAFLECVHPDDRQAVDNAYSGSVREGKDSYEIEHRILRRGTGELRWVHEKCQHVRDSGGRVISSSGMVLDITDRKHADDRLRRTAEELARSNKDLEQFAFIAGHDLQEPLRMVTGFLGLLRDQYKGRLDAQADQYIEFAVGGAERMSQMVRNLLTYSRVGSEGIKPGAVDFEEVLRIATANLQAAILDSQAVITHDPLPTLTADLAQMIQVFQNLISNAIKFRSRGLRPGIHVGADRHRDQWLFCVKDNGIGIDSSQAARIFMLFQRLHTKDKYPGAGIGLAICKKIIERHGGHIWVRSTPGQGSTFFFTLPA